MTRGMKVLVVGKGGREHAIAWLFAQSPQVSRVFAAPGNAGTAMEPKVDNVSISHEDIPGLAAFARQERVDLTFVGPEAPFISGIVDSFQSGGLAILGPDAEAAQIEGSKTWGHRFMDRHRIPSARWASFDEFSKAEGYLHAHPAPMVIKEDGLAAGKGVTIAATMDEAVEAAYYKLKRGRIVVEQRLRGIEVSCIFMVANGKARMLPFVRDFKRLGASSNSPMTGGMGSYSPVRLGEETMQKIMQRIVRPTAEGLSEERLRYLGPIYAGLMIEPEGDPRVLEFNCRLGDPETQAQAVRFAGDFYELCEATLHGGIGAVPASWQPHASVAVVIASRGYPDAPVTGDRISGVLHVQDLEHTKIFHAGTKIDAQGELVTDGGRVLAVTAFGETLEVARHRSYGRVKGIGFRGMQYRRDIAAGVQ